MSNLQAEPVRWAIALHGGAGASPDRLTPESKKSREDALANVLKRATNQLEKNATALSVVEQVVRELEDHEKFNAGKGSVFNAKGGHELDASIMDGKTKACGAVAGVTIVKNPITLARLVMTDTRHVMLSNDGADDFAKEKKVELVSPKYFWTERMKARYEAFKSEDEEAKQDDHKGTVGCVAMDQHGNLAAATSTGGLVKKKFGRVGDSPIIGAGTYADNDSCAVSGTGIGEEYIRHSIAFSVSARMKLAQEPIETAVQHLLTKVLKPDTGGIIAVSKSGQLVAEHNTPGMSYGLADSNGKFEVGLKK